MKKTADGNKLLREFWGLLFLFLAVFLGLSLFTYSPADPSLNQQVGEGHAVANQGGVVGAYLGGFLVDIFGLAGLVIPILFLVAALSCVWSRIAPKWWRWIGFLLLFFCLTAAVQTEWALEHAEVLAISGGGLVGQVLHRVSHAYFRSIGSLLIWCFFFLIGFQLSTGISWSSAGKRFRLRIRDWILKYRERASRKKKVSQASKPAPDSAPGKDQEEDEEWEILPFLETEPEKKKPVKKASRKSKPKPKQPSFKGHTYPPVDILSPVQESRTKFSQAVLDDLSDKLESCLSDFGVQGEVQRVQPGPVVTMFEYKPAPGVKISRIAGLSDDLSLALKAIAVRIVAPLPGKDTVGIEIPNETRQTVYLREIIESDTFQGTKHRLSLALGKDIQGQPRIADLAKMPHLLVAGATGAGKSVCLNSLLLSLLFKMGPDQLKLLLIDPKRIELAVYSSLPHLVHPVVTDMHLAKNALDWAVHEMEQRYEAMARLGVRNIDGYNQKLDKMGSALPEDLQDLEKLPYLVIVIDELADLMLTAAKEVEMSIVRLAQLARAAGIHIILATQRPSVDVVTGIIKANFPSRIAFQVSSKHDSRTILDTVGAEHLLGMGDMLFKGGAGKLNRVHGTFVSDDEIGHMVDFWSQSQEPEFAVDFTEWKKEGQAGGGPDGSGNGVADDPQYQEALDFVMEQGKASISLIQRRFRVGFNKAARFIEQMEQDGIIGPQEGSKPRQVLSK